MPFDRRRFVTGCSLAFAGAGLGGCKGSAPPSDDFDRLLAMHAGLPPENGGGANHYPMVAEALRQLAPGAPLPSSWFEGTRHYRGELQRQAPIEDWRRAIGDRKRHGDWLDRFASELREGPWQEVVSKWCSRLAPGLPGATFHGLIRTAHAVRGLQQRDTEARRAELAAGLAYWASRYTGLPIPPLRTPAPQRGLLRTLAEVEDRSAGRDEPGFHDVMQPLTDSVFATLTEGDRLDAEHPERSLQKVVTATATAFLEMLVQERNRIWLLHAVTGPAAVGLLLPVVGTRDGHVLVANAQHAVIALHRAYGAPFVPGANVRTTLRQWPELISIAVERGSVHGIKLLEALHRFATDEPSDQITRSVAEQWLEWT